MSIFSNIKDSVIDTTESLKEVMGGALKGACNVIMEPKKDMQTDTRSPARSPARSPVQVKKTDSVEEYQNSSLVEQMYVLNISNLMGSEYVLYIEDIMRMVTIQVIIQFMMYLQSPSSNKFFDANFIQIVLYVILGVTAYWLLVRKCVKVV